MTQVTEILNSCKTYCSKPILDRVKALFGNCQLVQAQGETCPPELQVSAEST